MERSTLGQHEYIHIINEPDADGINQNCDTGYPKVTVWDPAGVVVVDAVAMANTTAGEYIYQPALIAGHPKGTWPWRIELRTGGKISIKDGSFEVL